MGNSKSRNITKSDDNTKPPKEEIVNTKEPIVTNNDADKKEVTSKSDADESNINKSSEDQEALTTTSKTADQNTPELKESHDNLKAVTENISSSENDENLTKTNEKDLHKDNNQDVNLVKESESEVEKKVEIAQKDLQSTSENVESCVPSKVLKADSDTDKNEEFEKKELEVKTEISPEDLHTVSETHNKLKSDKTGDEEISSDIQISTTTSHEEVNKQSEEKQENEADEKGTAPLTTTSNVENDPRTSTTENSDNN